MSSTKDNDNSKCGFKTEESAWNYVYSLCCEQCQLEVELAKDLMKNNVKFESWPEDVSLDPACSCEYFVEEYSQEGWDAEGI